MRVELEDVEELRFDDGSPVRAASAVTRLGDGVLVVQDDSTHAAWRTDGQTPRVRMLPAVHGLETFDERSGTKHLKPDLEAACAVLDGEAPAVLVMGSGSAPARMRWVLLALEDGRPRSQVADMTPLYDAVADELDVQRDALNLEGACLLGETLRWFHRGLPSAGDPSASVDLDLAEVLAAFHGRIAADTVGITAPRRYDLGTVAGVGLAITDVVALPGGGLLCSAAAEDSPNVRDDGPVVGSALVLLDASGEQGEVDSAPLPLVDGAVAKVEGLMLVDAVGAELRLLAVVDADDPTAPSLAVTLRVRR